MPGNWSIGKLMDYLYPDDTYENRNPGQSYICFVFLCYFYQRQKTGSTVTLLNSLITSNIIYWVSQKLNEIFFQILTSILDTNVISEEMIHLILEEKPNSDSAQKFSSKCSSFWLTSYLFCLVDVFSNRQ